MIILNMVLGFLLLHGSPNYDYLVLSDTWFSSTWFSDSFLIFFCHMVLLNMVIWIFLDLSVTWFSKTQYLGSFWFFLPHGSPKYGYLGFFLFFPSHDSPQHGSWVLFGSFHHMVILNIVLGFLFILLSHGFIGLLFMFCCVLLNMVTRVKLC